MSIVKVDLGINSYDIKIEEKCSLSVASFLTSQNYSKNIFIVTNDTITKIHLEHFLKQFSDDCKIHVYKAKDSESSKSLQVAEDIYNTLIESNYTRDTVIIAFGGGVVGDLTGFVASTFYRGISFIQVPTTLLSQVDSSVGGKVAVNHPKGKNLIGAFYQPKVVFIDPTLLKTLPRREIVCGLAEVLKYGYIWEKSFLEFVKSNIESVFEIESETLTTLIKRCVEIKRDVVQQDEREHGIRAYLNFGHTFAHALEASAEYDFIKHGEAVIAGMICALRCSEAQLGEEKKALFNYAEEKKFLESLFRFENEKQFDSKSLVKLMRHDKKNSGEKITLVLLSDIGNAYKTSEISETEIEKIFIEIL